MANTPNPRSYSQTLAEMVATFVARTGITTLKVGNPVLTLLEAVAQSELHSTEDVYRLLQSVSLDNATGDALINIAADEGLTPISATASTTIGTAVLPYTKTYTTIAAGGSVVAGQSVIPVVSTAGFAAGNTVYVGGTGSNRESRVIASAVAGTITLTLPLSNSHLAGEEIVKSNVGTDTTITARTAVQTSANGTSTQIVFYTAEDYTILDGENTLTGMTVYCSVPGTVGNVPAGAISTFKTPPVPGATFTNTLPASNGTDAETPEALRNRIRLARQSRSRGTAVAITNAVIGAYAADEGRTISAATIVPRTTEPSVLYVSDGSGYEEKVSAWTSETLTSSAVGGETYFKLGGGLPVAKAFLKSAVGPFSIVDGSELTVLVGGVRYVHTFADADFSDPEVATGYEVVASINGASGLGFAARTSGNGTYVVIYAKSEFNDDIEVIGSTGVDANEVLGFALGRRDTLILTKNDQLLSKDGKGALLTSAPQAEWDVFSLSSIIVMTLNVDGTGVKTFTLTTTDFGITPVTNSTPLDAWVRAINAKVTGVTAYKSGTQLVIESNSGRSARASLVISGTFVSNDIFTSAYGLEDYGQDSDFTLNRATGVIELAQPLVDGDSLLAGYRDLRAFVEATPVGTLAANSLVAFVLDEEIEVLGQGSSTIAASGTSLTMTLTGITTPLPSVATNDWVIVWGMTAFGGVKYWVGPVTISGSNGTLVIPELVTPTPGYSSGVYVAHVRCANKPIVVDVSGTTNATTFAAAINAQAEGCTAEVDGASVRVRANSFGESGSVTVVMNSNTNTGFYLGQTSANRLPVTVVESSVAAPVFGTFDRIAPADTGNQTELNAGVNIVQTSYGTPNADESFSLVSDISAGLNRNFTVASDASNPLRTLRQNDGTGALDATIVRKDAYKVGPEDTLSYSMASTPSVVQSLKLFTNATGNGAGGFTVDMTNTPVSTNFDFSDFALLAKPLSTGSTSPYVVRLESQVYGSQLEGYSFELQVPKVPTTSPTVVVDASNASDKKVYTTIGTTGASATDSTYYKLVSTTDESGLDYQTAIQYNFQIDTTGVSFTSSNEWSVPLIINLPTLYGTNPIKLNSLATAIQTQLNSFLLSVTGKYLALKLVTDENSFGSYVGLAAGATAAFQLKSTTVTVTRSGTTLTVTGLKFLKTPVTGSPSGSYLISGLIGFTSNSSANSLFTSMPTLDGDGVVVFGGTGKVSYASSELYSTKLGLPVRNNPYTVNGSIAASVTNTTYTYLTTNAALNTKAVINARLLPFGVQLSSTATSFLIPFQTAQIGTALPGTWYIQSSTYSSGLYTFTMKDSGFPSTYNVEAVLVPTTAKNVADIMSDSDRNADPAITADATSIGLSIYSNDFTDGVAVSGTGALSSQFLATASTNDYTTIETGSVPYMAGRYRLGQTSMINKVVSVAATALQTTFDQVWFNDQIVTPANSTTPVTHVAVSSVKASYNGYSQLFLATNLLSNFDQARNGDTCYIYDGSGPVGDGYYQIVNIVPGSTNTGRVVWIKGTLPVGNLTTTYMTVLSFVESILPTDSIVFRDQGEVGAVNAGVPLVVTGLVDAPTMSNLMINNVRKVTVNNVPANASGLFSSYSVTQTEALDLVATLDTCLYDANTDTAYVTFDEQDILPHETAPWAMVSMNKLNPTSSSQAAVPAYHYDTGIIQLANKITQGDEQDATNYPGYAAVNNQIVVAAPVIKRIVLGLQIRIAGGYANTGNANATQTSIINLVKSAVAAAVNSTPIGSFGVAFSDIVAAANSVPGVDGVVITSPTYNISNDSIPLQSFEKPMVLKLDDVSVSVLGG